MDGLTIATAVIQFIEFTAGLIHKGVEIHGSASGLGLDHQELQEVTQALEQSSHEIEQSIRGDQRRTRLRAAPTDQELTKIASECQTIAKELLAVLSNLSAPANGPRKKWHSFRHALQASWNDGKVQALETRLNRYRQQLMVSILSSLRQEAARSIQDQCSIKESVEKILEMQRHTLSAGDRFVRSVAGGDRWRRELIQMIHDQVRDEFRSVDHQPRRDQDGSKPNAILAQEMRIRGRVLHKLTFRNMTDRERRITRAHQRTFEWIFCDPDPDSRPWSSFKGFLEHPTRKIYWITGKPGSGKSTLMKYVRQHAQTDTLLRTWGGEQVIRAAFYFWNSGSEMQMSVEGLLQTILYDCLHQLPEIVQSVLPERWEAATLFDVDDFPWTLEELAQALRRLVTEVCHDKRFFIMIDGLDECSGDQTKLVELVGELAGDTTNLKLCVASRPWNNFADAFKGQPSLMVQDLSAGDIEWFIRSRFEASHGFAEFQERDTSSAEALLKAISTKAEGVFLWVHLVVQSLLEGLTEGDDLRQLHQRLQELPPGLEELYNKILKTLGTRYLGHASQLFQLVRACDDSLTLLRTALADLEDDERALKADVRPMSDKEILGLCKHMRRKLVSRCRGLLEVSLPPAQQRPPGYMESPPETSSANDNFEFNAGNGSERDVDWSYPETYSSHNVADLEVQYLHRTVRDFIESPDIWSWLVLSVNNEQFNPHFCLLKSHLLHIKSLDPANLTAQRMGFHVWMAIKYGKRSINGLDCKAERVGEVVRLLDEMDRSATALTKPTGPSSNAVGFRDRQGTLDEDDHWSTFFLLRVPGSPSFLDVMTVCGVHQYLELRLPSPGKWLQIHDDGSTRALVSRLASSAIQGGPSVPQVKGYEELIGPHPEVLAILRGKGASNEVVADMDRACKEPRRPFYDVFGRSHKGKSHAVVGSQTVDIGYESDTSTRAVAGWHADEDERASESILGKPGMHLRPSSPGQTRVAQATNIETTESPRVRSTFSKFSQKLRRRFQMG